MVLTTCQHIREGGYSEVFQSTDGGKVFKLFTAARHQSNISQGLTNPEYDKHRRETFAAECDAYEIAMKHPLIRGHVPHFYGRVVITDVLDEVGNGVARAYLLDCCYAVEFLRGDAIKIGCYRGGHMPSHLSAVMEAMRAAGIRYLRDASVFMPEDAETFKIIDFATREADWPADDI